MRNFRNVVVLPIELCESLVVMEVDMRSVKDRYGEKLNGPTCFIGV